MAVNSVDSDVFDADLEVVIVEDEDALLQGDLGGGEGEEQDGEGCRQQHGLESWQEFVKLLFISKEVSQQRSLKLVWDMVEKIERWVEYVADAGDRCRGGKVATWQAWEQHNTL